MPNVLIVSGGWEGHRPHEVANLLNAQLTAEGMDVMLADSLDAFATSAKFDVVIPNWTMGEVSGAQIQPLLDAVSGGIGVAGLHGGMGDAFRGNTDYQFMTGGQFVAHPGAGDRRYSVNFMPGFGLTEGLADLEVATEKYYMHVDPAMRVLATTAFEDFGDAIMPVAWTKSWGAGRVFYSSLGHDPEIVAQPTLMEFFLRGVVWAANRSNQPQGATFAEVYSRA